MNLKNLLVLVFITIVGGLGAFMLSPRLERLTEPEPPTAVATELVQVVQVVVTATPTLPEVTPLADSGQEDLPTADPTAPPTLLPPVEPTVVPPVVDDNIAPPPVEPTIVPPVVDDNIVPPPVEPTVVPPVVDDNVAPPPVEPTVVPPVVNDNVAPPPVEPTVVPPVVNDNVAPPPVDPTAVPPVVNDKIAPPPVEPTAVPPLVFAPAALFLAQDSYAENCAERPAGTVCLAFSDGFVWLITDAVMGWEDAPPHNGQVVEMAVGAKGTYHHVLGTNLVKFVPNE